jgi:hypothetical protein
MKKIWFSFLLFYCCLQIASAQNVGIGNTNPQAVLDVQGDIRFRSVNITLATGFSGELNAAATKASVYNVSSAATITGISGGVDGRLITLVNTGAVSLVRIKLLDENDPISTSVAGNKTILGNTFFINQKGAIVFRYDGSLQRWTVVSKNGVNDGTVALWQQAGNDLYNSNTGNVGIGNSSPVAKLDVAGNVKITDGTQATGRVLTSDASGVATWQSPVSMGFKNLVVFSPGLNSWTVPTGVTKVMMEAWGGGGGGNLYRFSGNILKGQGGGAGGYAMNLVDVVPGIVINIKVGNGGAGERVNSVGDPEIGGSTYAENNSIFYVGAAGGNYDYIGDGGFPRSDNAGVSGEDGNNLQVSYGNSSATSYNLIVKLGDGGSAYHGGKGGKGDWFVSQNSASLLYTNSGAVNTHSITGGDPGGGGGAGYTEGGGGGSGKLLIWY